MERVPRRAAGCADRRSRLEQYQPHAAAQPRRRRAEGIYPRYAQPDRSDHWREIDRLGESERLFPCRHPAGDGWRRHRLYDRRDGFRHRVAAQYTGRAAHSPPLSGGHRRHGPEPGAHEVAAGDRGTVALFGYEVIRGTASNGQKSGRNLYPAPTLEVFPGERLIVHFENGLTRLTIRDSFIPRYTLKDQPVSLYPEQMTSSPINLHTHGAHISPRGNADNVMLHIAPEMSNTYTYDIPRNMPQGLHWYHCHLHGLTAAQVYAGLVGLLAVGRTDGNLPLVT